MVQGKWHQSTPTLIAAILILGPFAIPLIWINKKLSLGLKIVLISVLLLITGLLLTTTAELTKYMLEKIEELKALQEF